MMLDSRRSIILITLAFALTVFLMIPGLQGDFFFDDNPNIVDNTAIHITALNIDSLKASLNGNVSAGPLDRPISVLSFAVTYYFFGLDAAAFKAINLIIHLFNGFLLFWLLRLLLRKSNLEMLKEWVPLWVMTVWLIHPINFLPVMLAVQRMTLLSSMFMLLALISHITASVINNKSQKIILLLLSWVFFWPLSVLSKETGLLFPCYIIIISLFQNAVSGNEYLKNNKSVVWALISLLLIAVGAIWLLGVDWLEMAYNFRPFSLSQRLMTEARVLWFYVGQIIAPSYSSFAIYHDDFLLSTSMIQPMTTSVSVAAWILVLWLIISKWSKYSIICFSASWFLVGHILESTLLPLEIMHEHRNYFPSMGLITLVACMAVIAYQKLSLLKRSKFIMVIALTPIILLSFFTWMRADQLNNSLKGFQIEAAQHPQSARANYSAALALFKAGYGDLSDPIAGKKIQVYFEQAGIVDPRFKLGYLGLISWACASNRVVESSWVSALSYRLEHTAFDLSERDLPKNIFDTLSTMQSCISKEDANKLFVAGGNNLKIADDQRAYFFEYAADYVLFVWKDVKSAKEHLTKALAISPGTVRLEDKLKLAEKMIARHGQTLE